MKRALAMNQNSEVSTKDSEVTVYGEPEGYGPLKARLATFRQQSMTWSFNFLFLGTVCLLSVLTFGWFARRFSHMIMRTWGRAMLWITNVTLLVEPTDEISKKRSRIVTYNHSSTLDIFIITVVGPVDAMPIIKKELLRVPFIGWTCKALGFVALDRSNREKSIQSLNEITEELNEHKSSVIIAPEGTRNGKLSLKRFKLGAFRMAQYGQIPIVPVVFQGAAELMPRSQNYSRKGVVRVRFLNDYTPDRLEPENLIANAQELRSIYEENILDMRLNSEAEQRNSFNYPQGVK